MNMNQFANVNVGRDIKRAERLHRLKLALDIEEFVSENDINPNVNTIGELIEWLRKPEEIQPS